MTPLHGAQSWSCMARNPTLHAPRRPRPAAPQQGLQDHLQHLDLRNNRLQLAPQLGGLTGLRSLDLSSNLLMDVEALRPLTQLRALLLGFNCLHGLEPLRVRGERVGGC